MSNYRIIFTIFCVNTHFLLMAEKQMTRQQFLWYAWWGLLSK